MKLNLTLLIKLIILEILYFYTAFFGLGLFLFLNFGSGAGASSEKAILFGKIAIYFVVFPPILYTIFKMYSYKKKGKISESNSNLIAGILIAIFITYNYYSGFLGS